MSPSPVVSVPLRTYDEALHFLDRLDVSAMKLGLERIRRVLDTLSNPQDSLPMIHIAGTNGKGSVTAMLSAILKAAGLKVGSFTSPHLVHVRERIAVNGNPILPDDLLYEVNQLKQHLESLGWERADWPTYFEFLTIVAYRYFRRTEVDITVFETGLGGRLDATNAVQHPNLSIITTIGLDHTQHLGETLAAIAGEKAGILKAGTPAVFGPNLPMEAKTVILERAQALEVPYTLATAEDLTILPESSPATGQQIQDIQSGRTYRLSLLAPYQRENLATVLAAVGQLRQQGFNITEIAVDEGLHGTYWSVRFQYFPEQRILLDGSHNAQGFRALSEGLQCYFSGKPLFWVISLRCNRQPEDIASMIAAKTGTKKVFCLQGEPAHLYHPASTLSQALENTANPIVCQEAGTLQSAYEQLQHHLAENPDAIGIVTGSLYTAGALLPLLQA